MWPGRTMVVAGLMLLPGIASAAGQGQDRGAYYDGMRRGYERRGHGYTDHDDHRRYDRRDEYNRTHGGIGPGKGALIGGAGGAVVGALFGGGLKGALIGGGAGAGVGAVVGKVNQQRDYRE